MPQIKLSKTELRLQQNRLNTLEKFLPTLQLKKSMLQKEIGQARSELIDCERNYKACQTELAIPCAVLKVGINFDDLVKVKQIGKRLENIAGIEVPYFDFITFEQAVYSVFDTPPWLDGMVNKLRELKEAEVRIAIAQEKKSALEKELKDVSIKVNLFEKVLIPTANRNIRKIKVFLGDQQLAAISQAKIAKIKIEERPLLIEDTSYAC